LQHRLAVAIFAAALCAWAALRGIYATMALTSFASGALVTSAGWTWLNLGPLLPLLALLLALPWLAARRGRALAGEA
jgi:hypothetical protein